MEIATSGYTICECCRFLDISVREFSMTEQRWHENARDGLRPVWQSEWIKFIADHALNGNAFETRNQSRSSECSWNEILCMIFRSEWFRLGWCLLTIGIESSLKGRTVHVRRRSRRCVWPAQPAVPRARTICAWNRKRTKVRWARFRPNQSPRLDQMRERVETMVELGWWMDFAFRALK